MISVTFSSEAMLSPTFLGLGTLKKGQTHIVMKLGSVEFSNHSIPEPQRIY